MQTTLKKYMVGRIVLSIVAKEIEGTVMSIVFNLGEHLVCKRFTLVTQSSTEAEFVWLRHAEKCCGFDHSRRDLM